MMEFILSALGLMLGTSTLTTAWLIVKLDQRIRDLEEIQDQSRRR